MYVYLLQFTLPCCTAELIGIVINTRILDWLPEFSQSNALNIIARFNFMFMLETQCSCLQAIPTILPSFCGVGVDLYTFINLNSLRIKIQNSKYLLGTCKTKT